MSRITSPSKIKAVAAAMAMGLSPAPPPPPSDNKSSHDAAAMGASPGAGFGGDGPSTRNFKASQAASLAAAIEAASALRPLVPGLAELMGGSGMEMTISAPPKGGGVGGAGSSPPSPPGGADAHTHIMHAAASGSGPSGDDAGKDAPRDHPPAPTGHPSLPSPEAVSSAASRMINECPPFVTMSARDSAPQLRLEDPPTVDGDGKGDLGFQRKFVVRGGMKGYRMSRATHCASKGCYYFEVVILGSGDGENGNGAGRGVKRSFSEADGNGKENESHSELKGEGALNSKSARKNGHLRVGWSTRSADLQAPVGYNEHSYAIRDILGSRIHRSRREDRWGGVDLGPGDVLGLVIYLKDKPSSASPSNPTPVSSSSPNTSGSESGPSSNVNAADASNPPPISAPDSENCIYFLRNGRCMGGAAAFVGVIPGSYYPAVSCYADGAAHVNFGPQFVYQPTGLPEEVSRDLRPVSDLCPCPPPPDEVVDRAAAGGGGEGGRKGPHLPKQRQDDGMTSAFQALVRTEAAARHDALKKHMNAHRAEIMALWRERGLRGP
ncbi:hypothetical protein ACHAWF_007289 [Thalassiosira exigua]